mgnify:FL=1
MKVGLLQNLRLPKHSIQFMCDVLIEHGIDPDPLLKEAGLQLSLLSDPWGTLDGIQELTFLRAFCRSTAHIEGVAFVTGLRYSLISYGPIGLATLVSENVTAGLRVFTQMQGVGYALLAYDITEDDEGFATGFVADDQYVPPDLLDFVHERLLGSGPTFFRDLRQENLPIRLIECPLDRPKGWMNLEARWQTEIVYRAPRSCIHFHPGTGALKLPLANALLAVNYRVLCENMLETGPKHTGTANSVYQVLMQVRGVFPNAPEVAETLHLSERSLHRKLASQSMSYRQIIDSVRLRRARELLDTSELPLAEVADRLGFSETASLSRFFRRVSGDSPSAYRKTSKGLFASSR